MLTVSDAAAHSCREITPGASQHDNGAAGHVFAAVIACSFDDSACTGVAHAETLAGHAAEIGFALDCAIHHRIADDDVLFRLSRTRGIRIHDDAATRQSLADVIVGRALQLESYAASEKCAEALARDTVERYVDRIGRKPLVA